MTTRRAFLSLASVLVASPVPVRAQRIPRVGYLSLAPRSDKPSPERDAFLKGLRDLGYIEGKNIFIEYRFADWDAGQIQRVARELAESRVDLIFAPSEQEGSAIKQVTKTIPIVAAVTFDPVGEGLVSSLARPGANFTGLSAQGPELAAKRLRLLKEVLPKLKRAVVLSTPTTSPTGNDEWLATERSAREIGVALQLLEVSAADDYVKAFASITKLRPDALIAVSTIRMWAFREIIAEFAQENRLPTVFQFAEYVEAGGLMSYGPNIPDLFRRAAGYVDRILKGAKPGDLPIEQPTKVELVVNLKTARTLGLKIPQPVLLFADRIIG